MAILQHPGEVGADLISRSSRVAFADNTLAVIRDAVATNLEHVGQPEWVARIAADVPSRFETLVKQLAVAPIPTNPDKLAIYCTSVVSDIIDRDLLRRKKDVLGALQRLDSASEPERYRALQQESVTIEQERRSLRAE
jgi:DNA primase